MQYQEFPVISSKYTQAVCNRVREVGTETAKRVRKTLQPRMIVQHVHTELCALYEIAAGFHDRDLLDGYVLQCGTFCGGSACTMAHALKDANREFIPLLTIDNYTKEYAPLLEAFNNAYIECRENIWAHNLKEYVTLVLAEDTQYLKQFWSQPIRAAFIDSSHHYKHTKEEIQLIVPHLVDNGWLMFDDYFSDETPGVAEAVTEFLDESNLTFEIFRIEGLLILRKTP